MALQAQCRVYIAFADGPLVASPTWTDVTAYVRSVSTNRGRSTELDDFQTGSATVVLNNRLRYFDPDYSAGPYFGNIKVRRQIKIEGVYSGVTYPIFRGFIQSWSQQWPGVGVDATTTVSAVDLFALLASWDLPESAHDFVARSLNPSGWWSLADDDAPVDQALGTVNASYGKYRVRTDPLRSRATAASAATQTAATVGNALVGTAANAYSATNALTVAITFQTDFFDNSGSLILGNFTVALDNELDLGISRSGNLYGKIRAATFVANVESATCVADDNTHHVILTRNGTTISMYVDGVETITSTNASMTANFTLTGLVFASQSSLGSSDPTVNTLKVSDAVLIVGTAVTSTQATLWSKATLNGWVGDTANERIERVLGLLGVPSAFYNLASASTSPGQFRGGSDSLSYLQSVTRGEMGRLFVNRSGVLVLQARTVDMGAGSAATFADDNTASSVRYNGFELNLDPGLVYNAITVEGSAAEATATKRTVSSIASYSEISQDVRTELPTVAACRDVTDVYALKYAEPQVRGRAWKCFPERALNGTTTPGYATILGRELGDIVTVKRSPLVGGTLSKTVQITAISHSIDVPEGDWSVTFLGAPADTSAAFRWGTSNWGGTDYWNTNL